MPLTLEDVAKLSGVSRSTVSRVVNNEPNVRQEVRERVLEVIRETGYEPHAAARSLVTRRTKIIGVIIPESVTAVLTTPFFSQLLWGITQTCNARHYHLTLSLLASPRGADDMYRRVVRSGYLEGVIVSATVMDDPLIPRLLKDGVPFVFVGRHRDERVSFVDVDNVGASRTAVEYLAKLGHRRIATIAGPQIMSSGKDRLEGYRRALEAYGIPVEDELIVEGDYTEESGMAAALLLIPSSPTAVFAASDSMASGALKTLREAGLRVPQDVALVGFDDVPIAIALEPQLTTIHQPIEQMGEIAADLLLDRLDSPSQDEAVVKRIVLPGELVVRESCGGSLAI
jgi:LacI family transcriptional regulator